MPNADIVFNKVPKAHAMADIYFQLIQNFDESNPFYDMQPRIGAFEVSYNGVVSERDGDSLQLIFSKSLSGCWPSGAAVAQRCKYIVDA